MEWSSKYEPPTLGKTYGELTIIEDYRKPMKKLHDKIMVKCTCGVEKEVIINNLVNGRSTSCGCSIIRHLKKITTECRTNPSVYDEHIHKKGYFNGFTLIDYHDQDERDCRDHRLRTFTMECPNGHQHTTENTSSTPYSYTQTKVCWCMESNPLVRERRRNQLTLKEVGNYFGYTKQAIDLWEKDGNNIRQNRLLRLFEIYNTPKDTQQEIIRHKLNTGAKIT